MKNLLKISTVFLFALLAFSCSNDNQEEVSIENELLNLFEKSSLDDNVIIINSINNTTINYKVQDGWENAWSENNQKMVQHVDEFFAEPGDELCRGGGISFARCVKKAVDSGTCVKVYRENGGDYVAEEISC